MFISNDLFKVMAPLAITTQLLFCFSFILVYFSYFFIYVYVILSKFLFLNIKIQKKYLILLNINSKIKKKLKSILILKCTNINWSWILFIKINNLIAIWLIWLIYFENCFSFDFRKILTQDLIWIKQIQVLVVYIML